MTSEQRSVERRHHMRASAHGSVVLRGAGREVHGRSIVANETSLEVQCPPGFSLLALAGASVELEVRLDAGHEGWFLVQGQVARVRPESHTLIIALEAIPAELAALLAVRPRASQLEVLVVDSELTRRASIAEAFRDEGCHVSEVSTAAEALDDLARVPVKTDVIVVGDTFPDTVGDDLLGQLETRYTNALIVAAGGPEWTPTRARLDPTCTAEALRSNVRALLAARAA